MKTNRIILLTHEYPPEKGGAGTYCKEIAESAHQQKINIEVWAPCGSENNSTFNVKEMEWKGSQSWLSSVLLILNLRSFLFKKTEALTVHIAEPGACRAFIRLGWLLPKNIQKIITLHGSELISFTRNPLERILFRKLLNSSTKIHVLSKFNQDQCIKFCKQSIDKIRLIPGAPSSMVLNNQSRQIICPDTKILQILCVGRIHPRKGQLQLLQALQLIPRALQNNIRVVFAGPINKTSYQKKLKGVALSTRAEIIFTGEISDKDLRGLYQKSTIFALTPILTKKSVEGFGFVFLEASAFGLPIIATKVGGVEDAVRHGETGLLSNPSDAEKLKNNIVTLIENPSLRKKFGTHGITWAKRHTWETVAHKLYRVN